MACSWRYWIPSPIYWAHWCVTSSFILLHLFFLWCLFLGLPKILLMITFLSYFAFFTLFFYFVENKTCGSGKNVFRVKIIVFIMVSSYKCFAWAFYVASIMLSRVSILPWSISNVVEIFASFYQNNRRSNYGRGLIYRFLRKVRVSKEIRVLLR